MTQPRILLADDEAAITAGLSAILTDEGYEVDVVSDGQQALDKALAEPYGLVLADLKMPKVDGLKLLAELQKQAINTECIIITGAATIDIAVQAMHKGAYDFIEKPLNAEKLNKLKAQIPKALDKYKLKQQNTELTSRLEGLTHYAELTGQSEEMRHVYQVIDAVASSTASVLILGESGTGKELVARALHSKSDRAKGPFFAINCAALPKEILENELFGHEKGAFTGSTNEKQGAFENASGGSLFLDEVAEMATDIQVKLLRALETRSVRRLGGKKEIPVDIRVIAATNKNLQQAIADGELREDLYYRLAVVEIDLPPLRERVGDIKLLAGEFLVRFAQQNGKNVKEFDERAWDWILSYHWPGNVRELKNAVERAVIMARSPIIGYDDIVPRHLRGSQDMAGALQIPVGSSVDSARRQLVLRTFASTGGDYAKSAKLLGVSQEELKGDLAALLSDNGEKGVAVPPDAKVPAAVSNRSSRAEPASKGSGKPKNGKGR
jgi:DNA-binding NtrC family response regulator